MLLNAFSKNAVIYVYFLIYGWIGEFIVSE